MRKSDIKVRMQESFSELSPDIFEQVMKAAEQERPELQEMETEKLEKHSEKENSDDSKKGWAFWKGNIFPGSFTKYAISACACLAVFCFCLFGLFGKNEDDIYLVLDINPSIQIVMNDSFQVKSLKGLNQDGRDVIKKLKWKKREPLFDTLDSMIDETVKDSYLKENSGILVTICLPDPEIYEELEDKMGKSIDQKLKEIGISGVTTAFQQGKKESVEEGRRILETELAEKYGADTGKMQHMSVMELIRCGREYGVSGVTFSPESEKKWADLSKQKKEREEKEKEKENASSDKTKPQETKKPEVTPEPEKTQDGQLDEKMPKEEKKEGEKPTEKKNSQGSTPVQPQENTAPPAPAEVPASTEPVNSAAPDETQPESNVDQPEEDKDKNGSKGRGEDKDKKKNKKDKNSSKDKNGNSKDNKDKDKNSSGKDKNKDKDNSSNNKDKDNNSNNKDKDNSSSNKDKDNSSSNKDKDSSNNKDKNDNSSEKDNSNDNGNDKNSSNNSPNEKKDINKSSPTVDEIFLENI